MEPDRFINVHTHIHPQQDIDQRVAHWRECGALRVCVHATGAEKNALVAEYMKKYPDIILGFAWPGLGREVASADRVDELKDAGYYGLKFIAPSYPYDDERYYPLYERAEDLSMPILFHTGFLSIHPGQGERGISQEKMRAVRLDTVGRAFPGLRMMMAHLGNPEFHVGLDITRSFDNIWGEFSGHGGSKFRESVLRRVFQPMPGADMSDAEENLALEYFKKLCFATDNPEPPKWIAPSSRIMDELELPKELQEEFWWRNGARWLGMDESAL